MADRSFKDIAQGEDIDVFINLDEFADEHDLNGIKCTAVLQNISTANNFMAGEHSNFMTDYAGLYGSRILVNVRKSDLDAVPVYGQTFSLDGEMYLVESCADDMGILTIQLVANER